MHSIICRDLVQMLPGSVSQRLLRRCASGHGPRGLPTRLRSWRTPSSTRITFARTLSIDVDPATVALVEACDRGAARGPRLRGSAWMALGPREGAGFLRYLPGGFYRPHRDRGRPALVAGRIAPAGRGGGIPQHRQAGWRPGELRRRGAATLSGLFRCGPLRHRAQGRDTRCVSGHRPARGDVRRGRDSRRGGGLVLLNGSLPVHERPAFAGPAAAARAESPAGDRCDARYRSHGCRARWRGLPAPTPTAVRGSPRPA